MNLESGKQLSLEELKQRNRPTPPPIQHPTTEEWNALLRLLDELIRRTEAQEAALSTLAQRLEALPDRRQIEALARDVAALRETFQQAGRKNGRRHFRLPRITLPELPRPTLAWLWGTMAVAAIAAGLFALWYSWDALLNGLGILLR